MFERAHKAQRRQNFKGALERAHKAVGVSGVEDGRGFDPSCHPFGAVLFDANVDMRHRDVYNRFSVRFDELVGCGGRGRITVV